MERNDEEKGRIFEF